MMKAIVVTKDNKEQLTMQYNLDDGYLDDAAGLTLVAGFAEEAVYHGLFTKTALHASFTVTGKELNNGYFEVKRGGI